jgi:hypothetical protein
MTAANKKPLASFLQSGCSVVCTSKCAGAYWNSFFVDENGKQYTNSRGDLVVKSGLDGFERVHNKWNRDVVWTKRLPVEAPVDECGELRCAHCSRPLNFTPVA